MPQVQAPSNYFLKGNQGEYDLYDQSHLKTLLLDKTHIACSELCMYILSVSKTNNIFQPLLKSTCIEFHQKHQG